MHKKLLVLAIALGFFVAAPLQAQEMPASAPVPAPEIESPAANWINSQPLNLKALKGKVVLVDFWTYSCINCLRTLPYLRAWHEAYKDQGLVIVGVHAPEFDFEKNKANVEKAMKRFRIAWPIVQDNDHLIWNRYQNRFWPAKYLIDRDGNIAYTHFGEGAYEETETTIRTLLSSKGSMAKVQDVEGQAAYHQTAETYLGTSRAERLQNASLMNIAQQVNQYSYPRELEADGWALDGEWQRYDERSVARGKDAGIRLNFRGGKVFLVLGSEGAKPVKAEILLNGKPVADKAGRDVKDGVVEVKEHRLYELIDLKRNGASGEANIIEIKAREPGLEAYAFTFGG